MGHSLEHWPEHWYVAQTRPNQEAKALVNLLRQGFRPYLPRYARTRRHARRVELVERPLFPGYLFVRMDPVRNQWRAILSTIGISHVVCQGGLPLPVPEGVVEEIMAREDPQGLVPMVDGVPLPKPGAAVTVADGPFAACRGLFDSISDDERVCILLDLLGREVKVCIPLESMAL